MIDFTRVDHIGQVVPDLAAQRELLEGLFGFRPERTWEDPAAGSRGISYEVPGGLGVRWEVLSPLDGAEDSAWQAFIDGPRGPGVHHVALAVDDAAATADAIRALGLEPAHAEGRPHDVLIEAEAGGQGLTFRCFEGRGVDVCGPGGAAIPAEPLGASGKPALGVKGIDHLCHACPDRDELGGWYARAFGMRERWRTPPGEHEDLADLVMDVPGETSIHWEVLQPIGEESFVQRFLDRRGPSVHHVTFEVEDWAAALAACDAHEIPYFDENAGETDGAAWHDAFIHPRYTGGMLVQFFWEAKPGVWVRSDKVPSDA